MTAPRVRCHYCPEIHPAEFSHMGRYGEGRIYAVVCTSDPLGWVEDYYTSEALV